MGVVINSPAGDIMSKAGLMGNIKPYRMMVDRRYDSPDEEMVKDIRSGEVDSGVLWGPIAGYFAERGDGEKLTVVPLVKDAKSGRTEFRITMGVRQGEDLWKRQLNDIIRKRQADFDRVLLEYGVPMIDEDGQKITEPRG
jgi:ABC-type amino acid transport substrate-binding protein